jgi:hypothetical protein
VAPVIALAVSERVVPEQTETLAGTIGAAVMVFTVTIVVPAEPVHPLTVAVTEYVPLIAAVALALTSGFCSVDVKPLGPVQLYVAPEIVLAVSERLLPAQTGPVFPAVGAAGKA